MAQQVLLICDRCEEKDGVENVKYSFGGQMYEVDLCEKDRSTLDKVMKSWLEISRPVTSYASPRQRSAAPSDDDRGWTPQQVREWAAGAGVEVATKGRIPDPIIQQYLAAQTKG